MKTLKSGIERRAESNEKIKKLGISCFEELPLIEDSTQASLKSIDEICRRAIACLLSTQLAYDITQDNDYEESRELFYSLLKKYGVEDCLNEKEQKLFSNKYQKQDAIDIVWTYEAYWSLVWALGLVENITYPYDICDCEKAIKLVGDTNSYEEFKKQCHMRDVEEILDMLDLYYRYDWAVTEKRINPDTTNIGLLNPDVVVERRRGLEWLICDTKDWNDISLDT